MTGLRGGVRALVAAGLALVIMGAGMQGDVAAQDHSPGAPGDLRVDEAVSPLWVTGAPTFGWIPSDPDRDEVQTAYRFVVSSAPTTDPKAPAVVFDTGKVTSSAESNVAAPRLRLEPDHRYWWTVQTWDRANESGPFARPSPFDTALGDADWHADWIRRPETPANPFEDYFLVRHTFTVDTSPVVRARAYVAASQQYELYIDGVRVDAGPSYSYPDEQYYQPTDITAALRAGSTNAVALIVHNLQAGQGRPAAPPGVIAHITIDHADGTRQTVATDGTWRVHEGPWLPGTPRNDEGDFIENIDARLVPADWASTTFDDSAWEHALVVGPHPTKPWTHLVAQRTRVVEQAVKPVTFRKLAGGSYVADFGSVIAATPAVTLHAGRAGRRVTLLQGYLLESTGHVSTSRGTQETDMHDDYTERDGAQTVRPFGYLGFRYLEIVNAQEPLTAADVVAYARHSEMPDLEASTFSSSTPILDRIWALAQHSALYGSQEQFIDTPTRERGQFGQDSSNTSSVTTVAFDERNLTWQALRDFARSQKRYWPDGRVNAVYPNGDGARDIPDLTENYVDWVLRYYELTGDRTTLGELYPVIVNIGNYVNRAILAPVGLVTNLPGGGADYDGGIVDWPPQMRYGYDKTSVALTTVNIIAIEMYRDLAVVARELHRPASEINADLAKATALTTAVNARLRRPDGIYIDGLHQDGTKSPHASQQANAYALAAGIVPAADRAAVVHEVVSLGMAMGPDIAAVLLEALHNSGNDQALVNLVSNPDIPGWAQILSRGATFTWESWDARDVPGDSESHAWGSTVLPALTTDILGVKVAAPGAAGVEIATPRTNVRSASGRLATERGPVSVAWDRVDSRLFTLNVSVPDNVTATVTLPAAAVRDVRESGRAVSSVAGVKIELAAPGTVRLAVGSGRYSFAVAPAPPTRSKSTRTPWIIAAVLTFLVLLGAAALLVQYRRSRARAEVA